MNGPQAHWLEDRRRLHLNHGPIDLVIEVFGPPTERQLAYEQAVVRFETVLGELVEELAELRRPATLRHRPFWRTTARRMEQAVSPLAHTFITPMAAVAGSVADEVLAALVAGRTLDKAYVNNGGDIALHLAPGQTMTLAIGGTGRGRSDRIAISADNPVRGIATSGWRGRSFSLGIADAVTVLARNGAAADAAATLIANAVDLPGHPAVARQPAWELAPDSDLGGRLVTTDVGALSLDEVEHALTSGLAVAEDFHRHGLIEASALFLGSQSMAVGNRLLANNNIPPHPASASLGRPLPEGRGARRSRCLFLLPSGEKVAAQRPDEGANTESKWRPNA